MFIPTKVKEDISNAPILFVSGYFYVIGGRTVNGYVRTIGRLDAVTKVTKRGPSFGLSRVNGPR